jgi:hypothetical protein
MSTHLHFHFRSLKATLAVPIRVRFKPKCRDVAILVDTMAHRKWRRNARDLLDWLSSAFASSTAWIHRPLSLAVARTDQLPQNQDTAQSAFPN